MLQKSKRHRLAVASRARARDSIRGENPCLTWLRVQCAHASDVVAHRDLLFASLPMCREVVVVVVVVAVGTETIPLHERAVARP